MSNEPLSVAHIFAVSLHHSTAFLVERGIANAAETLITAHQLPEAEVYKWIATALNTLLHIQVPKVEQTSRAEFPESEEVKFYSRVQDGLVHFVDFGAAGIVTHITTHDDAPERMVVGSLSSRPNPKRTAATMKKLQILTVAVKNAEDALLAKLDEAVEEGVWQVDTLLLRGVRHVLLALKEVEGSMSVTFPALIPELAKLKVKYIAQAKKERKTQAMMFLQH